MNYRSLLKWLIKKTGAYGYLKNGFDSFQNRRYRDIESLIRDKKDLPLPRNVVFEPTTRCNLNCHMCPQREDRKQLKPDLPLDKAQELLTKLKKQLNIKSMGLIGGEVFVRSDIMEILKTLEYLKVKVYIASNGTLIDEGLAEKLKKLNNIAGLGFSLDGLKDRHDRIRGRDTAFSGVKRAVDLLKDDFSLTVNTVVMEDNIPEIVELAKLIRDWGVPNHTLQFEMSSTAQDVESSAKMLKSVGVGDIVVEVKEKDNYDFSAAEVGAVMDELNKISGLSVIIQPRLYSRFPTQYLDGRMRQIPGLSCKDVNTLRISAQGEMIFCPFIKKGFGSLLDNDIAGIWNSAEAKEFRFNLYSNNLTPICKRCCRLGQK